MSREVRKILVVQLGPLADFVAGMAAMARIRATFPRARITLLTISRFEALAKASPYFNEVLTDGWPGTFGTWWSLRGRLRAAKFDRVFDLQLDRPAIGSPPWPQPNRKLSKHAPATHTLERNAAALQAAGIWPDAPTQPGSAPIPDLGWILRRAPLPRPTPGSPQQRPFALLVPGGLAKTPKRRWPVERYGELAKKLRERGLDIVIVGRPDESALARYIQKAAGQARDLTGGSDFSQIVTLGARAALAIGGDTGVTHLIAAAGAPTIALLAADRDPVICGPRGHVTVVQADNLAAMPVDTVLNAARSLLP